MYAKQTKTRTRTQTHRHTDTQTDLRRRANRHFAICVHNGSLAHTVEGPQHILLTLGAKKSGVQTYVDTQRYKDSLISMWQSVKIKAGVESFVRRMLVYRPCEDTYTQLYQCATKLKGPCIVMIRMACNFLR